MKRSVLALILVLFAFFKVYGQNTPMDVVLILDTSSGMGSSYENVSNYITGSFLSEYLRVGDTFHLIAFSGSPRLDIARRITSIGDVETIIGRMLIQYPVERGSNIGSAISYAEQYAASLPARPKKIVLVSTGGDDTNSLVSSASQRLSPRNISIDFVQVVPGQSLRNLPSSGRPVASRSTSAPAVTTPTPAVTTPSPNAAQPGASATTQSAADTTAQPGTSATTQPAAGTTAQSGTGTAAQPGTGATTQPAAGRTAQSGAGTTAQSGTGTDAGTAAQPGTAGTGIAAGESENKPAAESETREPVRETVTPSPLRPGEQGTSNTAWTSSMPIIIGLIILALIILGIILFFATRRLGSSPNRVMAQAASSSKPELKEEKTPFVDHSKDLAKYAAVQNRQRSTPYADRPVKTESAKQAVINPSGPLLLNMFVEDQNKAIGKRNIHSLKSGYSLSVGGGNSDFLIFLVPIPANIGEIRRNGGQCSFIPKKPKYFPDLGSNELRDCINKTIRVVSDKNYELRFRFEMYEDPLVELNRVLMSVSVPG
jgi:hypothetical protein